MEHAIACVVLVWIIMFGAVSIEKGMWKKKRGMVKEPQKYEICKSTETEKTLERCKQCIEENASQH